MLKVFISSTHDDLRDLRSAASNGVNAAGCLPVMTEYWRAQGNKTSYEICFDKVRECDVLVVIVAHRYGWEPKQQEGAPEDRKNMVWLECLAAKEAGKEVLAVIVDDNADWPREKKDSHELVTAAEDGTYTPELAAPITRGIARLKDFKQWLRAEGSGIVKYFEYESELEAKVEAAIRAWNDNRGIERPARPQSGTAVPPTYFDWVKRKYGSVELLGLEAEEAHAGRLRQVYVPAVTDRLQESGKDEERLTPGTGRIGRDDEKDRPALLLDILGEQSVYVPGEPGAGKSTFCQWLAWTIANGSVPAHAIPSPAGFEETLPAPLVGKLPVLVVLRDFWSHMECGTGVQKWYRNELEQALATWLDKTRPGGLTGAAFFEQLAAGQVVLAFDGVDEVTTAHGSSGNTTHPRACLLSALSDALGAWQEAGNRIVVTSRPYGLSNAEVRRLHLPVTALRPLPQPLQELFIKRWYSATDTGRRDENTRGLRAHLASRNDLKELTQSPLLLTALCIRFAQGQRLPDDLYELYDGLVSSVLFSRYGADGAERDLVRKRLSAIAYGMSTGAKTRLRTTPAALVGNDEADEHLRQFADSNWALEDQLQKPAQRRIALLERSGLLQAADEDHVQFFHLSFQEFLSADHILRIHRSDDLLLTALREHAAEKAWRPTLLFLFTALVKRDPQHSLELLSTLSGDLARKHVAQNPTLAALIALCAEVLLNKRVSLGPLGDALKQICLHAIEDEVEVQDRQILGLTLGRLGDPRVTGARDPAGFVEIPAGEYRDSKGNATLIKEAFWLARYPVTNAQFAEFMQAGGYTNGAFWSHAGAAWLAEEKTEEPAFWRDARVNAPNQPVVGVSYWEAEAYAQWAGCRLPSDEEWGAAAGGLSGREYPWGNDWEDGICNTRESGLKALSPVGLFPRSEQADFGLQDIAGNVFEWCRTCVPTSKSAGSIDIKFRVVRGGSWADTQKYVCGQHHYDDPPSYRLNQGIGFRLVLRKDWRKTHNPILGYPLLSIQTSKNNVATGEMADEIIGGATPDQSNSKRET